MDIKRKKIFLNWIINNNIIFNIKEMYFLFLDFFNDRRILYYNKLYIIIII